MVEQTGVEKEWTGEKKEKRKRKDEMKENKEETLKEGEMKGSGQKVRKRKCEERRRGWR